jgi:hypothetical protein
MLVSVLLVSLASALSEPVEVAAVVAVVAVVAVAEPLSSLASAPWWAEMSVENDDYSIRLWSSDALERSAFEEQMLQPLGETMNAYLVQTRYLWTKNISFSANRISRRIYFFLERFLCSVQAGIAAW